MEAIELNAKDYRSDIEPTWCPGCGDFAVTNSICKAMAALKWDPNNTAAVSGIGCSSRLPLWLSTFGFHSCHGRALPVAIGMKLAKPDMNVVVTIGDGDAFSIGGGHMPHGARRNMDMTVIVMDNLLYALTKNQVSPTSREGSESSTTPYGCLDAPVNTISLMLTYGATFVAQAYAGSPKVASDIIEQAMAHKGFSFVNILSPCPTYNKVDTFQYYKGHTHDINETHTDLSNKAAAIAVAERALDHETDDNASVPVGIYYKSDQEIYQDKVAALQKRFNGDDNFDVSKLFDDYRA